MREYLQILGSVIPIFLLMGIGAGVRRAKILNEEADRTLLDLVVHLLMPCLILDHIMASDALRRSGNLLASPLLGFLCMAGSLGMAGVAARVWGFPQMSERKTFTFTAGFFNYGYMAVPLVATLYGARALGVLFVFNLGVEVAFWTVGFSLFVGHSPLRDWRRILTTPVKAILLGVAVNLLTAQFGLLLDDATLDTLAWGWPVKVIFSVIHQVGLCSIPMAMLITGATMADFWDDFRKTRGAAVMGLAVLVRNVICPFGFVALAWILPVSMELKETLVAQAAMPAGILTLLLARHNGGNVPVALQVIFATSAAAIITLPLWIHFGMLVVGAGNAGQVAH